MRREEKRKRPMLKMATICTFVICFDVYDDNILIKSQAIILMDATYKSTHTNKWQ